MKVLTAAEMREVDRRTMELGISGTVLMENAGHRVVEFLEDRFSPLSEQRVVVLCGKGNNGGDGLVIARQLFTRFRPAALHVVVSDAADESEPLRMLRAAGLTAVSTVIAPEMRQATLVVDAVLGTGLSGAARGRSLELIREINSGFPLAKVVAVDIPSGMPGDGEPAAGEVARADATVTFTAPKVSHVLPPNCDRVGELRVGHIGSPASLYEHIRLHATEPADFRAVLAPRAAESNKGTYGHVLVVGGNAGKAGAAEMAGVAALRSGAGLVTVACSEQRLGVPELMTAALPHDSAALNAAVSRKDVIAIGPGLGTDAEARELLLRVVESCSQPVIIDADGLNVLAGAEWQAGGKLRVVTPHPGEMSRLTGRSVAEVQADRLGVAREYAESRGTVVVLKGHRTVIALPDGRTWINPTGSPAMATGGTGDVLTGMIAGLLAQYPRNPEAAVLAGVYLHGLAGELGARDLGDKCLIATDLLRYLPEALRAAAASL
jgi:NAD(P)H-hydrate epimerase